MGLRCSPSTTASQQGASSSCGNPKSCGKSPRLFSSSLPTGRPMLPLSMSSLVSMIPFMISMASPSLCTRSFFFSLSLCLFMVWDFDLLGFILFPLFYFSVVFFFSRLNFFQFLYLFFWWIMWFVVEFSVSLFSIHSLPVKILPVLLNWAVSFLSKYNFWNPLFGDGLVILVDLYFELNLQILNIMNYIWIEILVTLYLSCLCIYLIVRNAENCDVVKILYELECWQTTSSTANCDMKKFDHFCYLGVWSALNSAESFEYCIA